MCNDNIWQMSYPVFFFCFEKYFAWPLILMGVLRIKHPHLKKRQQTQAYVLWWRQYGGYSGNTDTDTIPRDGITVSAELWTFLLVKLKLNKQEQSHFYHLQKYLIILWFHLIFLAFSVRSCLSICLIAKFHHFINKTGIVSPWIYSQKLRHLRYINLVWMKHWHLIKILFCAWKSSAQNRKFHMIVVICSLYHAIFHIQIIFLVLPVSLNELVSSVPTSKSWFLCKRVWLTSWNYWKAKMKDLIMIQKHKFQLCSRLVSLCYPNWPNCFVFKLEI